MERDRRFAWKLLTLFAAAAALRALLWWEELDTNPFAVVPWSDAALYWGRAGEMAAGQWRQDGPFLIAPLYPHLLGVLRTLGLGLPAVYALQLVLNLAAGVLVADAARRRWGVTTGLWAAALFLLLGEGALFATRVLSVTLQVFLVALLWWDWTRLALRGGPARGHELRVGCEIGVLALAFPAALLLVPAYSLWLLASAPDRRSGALRGVLGAAAALLTLSPATLHNALASDELVLITAHAGVTLAHGNGPQSDGVYTPLDGVSRSVFQQHADAALSFETEQGRPGTWREIDAHFRSRVFAWWLEHPGDALVLLGNKLRWLATSRHYDNVAVFSLERERGLARNVVWLPMELPFLLGAAALGLALARRGGRAAVPELTLLALPVLVCCLFYYSARYRLVTAPVLCGLAALAIVRWRELEWPRAVVLVVAAAPVLLLGWNAWTGFGRLDFMREDYTRTLATQHVRAGAMLERTGNVLGAEEHYRRAVDTDPANRSGWAHLYDLSIERIDYGTARNALEGLLRLAPEDRPAHLALAWLLASCPDSVLRDGAAARSHAERALELGGRELPDALLVLSLALAESHEFADAAATARRGADLARESGDAVLAADLERLAETVGEQRAVASPPRRLGVEPHQPS
jgi:tetratricopeptide (TPR) repeat protein